MSRLGLSLKWLLGFAALAAIAIVVLVNTSYGVWFAVRTVSWAVLLLTAFGSIACREARQRFFLAFAVIAWGNLFFFFFFVSPATWLSEPILAGKYTDVVHLTVMKVWETIRVEIKPAAGFGSPTQVYSPDQYLLWDTGVHLLSLLLGFIAGSVAGAAHRPQRALELPASIHSQ